MINTSAINHLPDKEMGMMKDAYRHPFEYISPILYYDFETPEEKEVLK